MDQMLSNGTSENAIEANYLQRLETLRTALDEARDREATGRSALKAMAFAVCLSVGLLALGGAAFTLAPVLGLGAEVFAAGCAAIGGLIGLLTGIASPVVLAEAAFGLTNSERANSIKYEIEYTERILTRSLEARAVARYFDNTEPAALTSEFTSKTERMAPEQTEPTSVGAHIAVNASLAAPGGEESRLSPQPPIMQGLHWPRPSGEESRSLPRPPIVMRAIQWPRPT